MKVLVIIVIGVLIINGFLLLRVSISYFLFRKEQTKHAKRVMENDFSSELEKVDYYSRFHYIGGGITEVYQMSPDFLMSFLHHFKVDLHLLALTQEQVRRNQEFLLYVADNLFFFLLEEDNKVSLSFAYKSKEKGIKIEKVEDDSLSRYHREIMVAISPLGQKWPSA